MDDVIKRVRLWKEVEPFYPDQTRGLPKTSESRGTESMLNAVILATRDAHAGQPSDDARLALDNMWALQFRSGDLNGGWAWLNFHNEPWEANESPYLRRRARGDCRRPRAGRIRRRRRESRSPQAAS